MTARQWLSSKRTESMEAPPRLGSGLNEDVRLKFSQALHKDGGVAAAGEIEAQRQLLTSGIKIVVGVLRFEMGNWHRRRAPALRKKTVAGVFHPQLTQFQAGLGEHLSNQIQHRG